MHTPKSSRAEFHRRRLTGIGGSDVGAIVGVDPYRNALDVYLEKTGEVEPDEAPTPVQERGRFLEPVIRQLYKLRSGRRLQPARFRRHPEHKWMIGHPDSLVMARDDVKEVTDERGVFEAKTMMRGVFKKVVDRGLPEHNQLQGIHYGTLCKHRWVTFAVLQPDSWQFVTPTVVIEPAIQQQVVEVCEHFWYNHVVPQQPPKPRDPEWTIDLPEVEGEVEPRTDPSWRAIIEKLQDMKALKQEADELYEEARQALRDECGHLGQFEGAGARVYFKERERQGAIDPKRLLGAGLLDPLRVQAWLMQLLQTWMGEDQAVALIQADVRAGELRADLEAFRKNPSRYKDLRVYHISDQEPTHG